MIFRSALSDNYDNLGCCATQFGGATSTNNSLFKQAFNKKIADLDERSSLTSN